MADILADLILEMQSSNKDNKAHLHQVESHTRNSRRHLLEMKKDVIVMSENIAKMANVVPKKSESEDTEQRRENAKADKAQTDELKKIAAGIAGMKGGAGGKSGGGSGGKGLFGGGMLGLGGLGVAALAANALKGAAGLVAMGVAIPAFFGGLVAGDAALSWMKDIGADFNFTSLKAAALGFSDMIMSMDIKSFAVLGSIMAISMVGGTKAAKGLGVMGVAISAFLGGLLVGDALIAGAASMGWVDMNFSGMKAALTGFSGMIMNLTPEAQIALGVLIAGGAAAGLVGRNPTDVAVGMSALGAGISGLFVGLAVGDKAMGWLNTDFSAIAKAMRGFNEAVGALSVKSVTSLGLLLGTGMAIGKLTNPKTKVDMLTGIATLTAGIGTFFLGFAGMDAAAKKIGEGNSAKILIGNFGSAIDQLSEKSMKTLGAILGIGVLFGATGLSGPAAIGMGAVGAGIAAFFLAFDGMAALGGILGVDGSSTKKLVGNMVDSIKPLEELDGEKLLNVSKALPGIGTGIAAFFAGDALGSLSETAKQVGGFIAGIFGIENDAKASKFEKMVEALEPLKKIDPNSTKNFTTVMDDLERMGNFDPAKFSRAGVSIKFFADKLKMAMPQFEEALYGGGGRLSGGKFRGFAQMSEALKIAMENFSMIDEGLNGRSAAPATINNYYYTDQSTPTSTVITGTGSTVKANKDNFLGP